MDAKRIATAVDVLEAEVSSVDADRMDVAVAHRLLGLFARVQRVGAAGSALVARRIGDPRVVARTTGTAVGKARDLLTVSRRLADTPALADAVRRASVSLDQATEIARAETQAPGSAAHLVEVAHEQPFHELRRRARDAVLADDRATLAERQHKARCASYRVTRLGMIRLEADLEPHIGTPIVNRLERKAKRLARKATGDQPFGAHLADALADALAANATDTDKGKGRTGSRIDMVILVSHEITQRNWSDVTGGEMCIIPGVGPVDPQVAKRIAANAFLSGLFYDGTDLRQLRTWGRRIPQPVRLALNLGPPPAFDGPRCVDCGNRQRLEADHQIPLAHGGPTSLGNLPLRCTPCHLRKTTRDRQHTPSGSSAARPPARDHPPPRDRGP